MKLVEVVSDHRPAENQDLENTTFDVSFRFPTGISLCIELVYLGGNPYSQKSYRFSHANLWRRDCADPEVISRGKAREMLKETKVHLKDAYDYLV